MDKNVLEWLELSALSKPDKVALCDEDTSLNYNQVQRYAQSIGSYILSNIGNGKPVVVISGRHVHTLIGYLGILYSGGYYVPVDATSPKSHIERIIEATGSHVALVDKQGLSIIQGLGFKGDIVLIDDVLDHPINEVLLDSVRRSQIDIAPLYVIFTSGSTGEPKGVVTSHRAVATFVQGYVCAIAVNDTDVIGSQSPLDYVGVVKDFYTSLKLGATMFIIPKRCFVTTDVLMEFLNKYQVSVIAWTVAALTIPINNGAFDQNTATSLRTVCFTGSVMHAKYLRVLQEKLPGVEFVNLYGPTELTSNCLFYKVKSMITDDDIIPIGSPFEGYNTFIINDNGEKGIVGETGELYVGGSALSLGYFKNSNLTAQFFVQNPLHNTYSDIVYKTGDYCSLQADGNYIFLGRKDRMVKHHGYRVELDEIENISRKISGINECSCIYDGTKDQLYLFYDGDSDEKQVFIHLRKELPAYKIPRKIIRLAQIPLMKNYKVDIGKLKTMMNNGA